MSDKITAPKIRAMKGKGEKIVAVTAYDAVFGALADEAGVDLVLVGDSVGNVVLGFPDTLGVTLDHMVHHTRAVRQGVKRALLVADMPFGSYQESAAQAVRSAVVLMQAGAEAVKLEGRYEEQISAIFKAGIPVMGHLGMTPQSVNRFGGFRVQGRGESGQEISDAAKAIEAAGVFSYVLELIPADLACEVTIASSVPTVGIGAGPCCDGQVQVLHDLLGLSSGVFKHAKLYADLHTEVVRALSTYAEEVRAGQFPGEENSF